MKALYIFTAVIAVLGAGCDNRNTDSRDVAPNSPADSQVAHPSVPAATISPSPTPQPQ